MFCPEIRDWNYRFEIQLNTWYCSTSSTHWDTRARSDRRITLITTHGGHRVSRFVA